MISYAKFIFFIYLKIIQMQNIIDERRVYCETRLSEIRNRISKIEEVKKLSNFCIYATGSYARHEASKHSDLDMFFIVSENTGTISKLTKTLIDAELIKMIRNMDLPDFSGDGSYLQIHSVNDLIYELGSTNDDYKNYFTARLLLLLESSSLFNDQIYHQAIKQIIERYYVDFTDHQINFRPVFLTNDIIRFWKTLTINYEHKRQQDENDEKYKGHYKNLKLKFSRRLTCFSFVLQILSKQGVINPEHIIEIVKLTPIERLKRLNETNRSQTPHINGLLELYSWFLQEIDRPKEELYKWLADKEKRDDAFSKSQQFFDLMYEIMKNIDNGLLKYLIV